MVKPDKATYIQCNCIYHVIAFIYVGAVTVPVVMMLIQNIVSFLPSTAPGLSNTRGVSALLTAQVGARSENNEPSQMSPVSLTFGIDSVSAF